METTSVIKSLHEHIVSLAKTAPERTALLSCNEEGKVLEEITFAELSEKIESAGNYLAGLSLKSGDRVALAFSNSAELLILSWASWSMGVVTVPLDIKRDTAELHQYKIKLSNAKLLIAQKGLLKDADKNNLQEVKIIEFAGFPKSASTKIEWRPDLSHEALILFTSGTTAQPKGAKLSLENLVINAEGIKSWLRIGPEDRFLVNLPLHHINSTTFCLSALLAGGSIAIPPTYSNSHFWGQAAKTGATLTSIVQSILFDQLSQGDEYAKVKGEIKLGRIQIGSAPVVAQTAEEFIKKFKIPLYQGYGQTETALRVTGVPMGLPEEIYARLVEENSIGVPMSWADIQIADEEGKILGENEEGELVVKGRAVMEGYLGGEPAFRNNYFLTGDVGFYKTINGQRFFY
ncbi:MAG: long-chain fatty acid--CoA ligase, partial [Candidatus Kaiserbacteria bacterium]|nr:long-chain fatty acid--CoA ligase [Candidatus Kaiserbacteria bacterium]